MKWDHLTGGNTVYRYSQRRLTLLMMVGKSFKLIVKTLICNKNILFRCFTTSGNQTYHKILLLEVDFITPKQGLLFDIPDFHFRKNLLIKVNSIIN